MIAGCSALPELLEAADEVKNAFMFERTVLLRHQMQQAGGKIEPTWLRIDYMYIFSFVSLAVAWDL